MKELKEKQIAYLTAKLEALVESGEGIESPLKGLRLPGVGAPGCPPVESGEGIERFVFDYDKLLTALQCGIR